VIIDLIRNEFQNRKRTNPQYSLRSYARFLGVQPGRLSEYLSERRVISNRMAEKMSARLGVSPLIFKPRALSDLDFIEDEAFAVIADWQHFAILSLMDTKTFKHDSAWIAKRLGISELDAKEAIRRLVRVGLVEKNNQVLVKKKKNVFTGSDRESTALKLSHTQSLQQAISALHDVPVELRDVTSITMAINIKKLPIAKKMITEFRRKTV
jgi:transcriptional regulator with XRE-family HTH domain